MIQRTYTINKKHHTYTITPGYGAVSITKTPKGGNSKLEDGAKPVSMQFHNDEIDEIIEALTLSKEDIARKYEDHLND
jgi:hypothetical protein